MSGKGYGFVGDGAERFTVMFCSFVSLHRFQSPRTYTHTHTLPPHLTRGSVETHTRPTGHLYVTIDVDLEVDKMYTLSVCGAGTTGILVRVPQREFYNNRDCFKGFELMVVTSPVVDAQGPPGGAGGGEEAGRAAAAVAPPPDEGEQKEAAVAPGGAVPIEMWLNGINPAFGEYAKVFADLGLENTSMFAMLETDEDVAGVIEALEAAKCKRFHLKKIRDALKSLTSGPAATSTQPSADPSGSGIWLADSEDALIAAMNNLEAVAEFCVVEDLQKIAAAKKDKDQAIWTVEVAKAFGVMLRAVARCKAGGAAILQTE